MKKVFIILSVCLGSAYGQTPDRGLKSLLPGDAQQGKQDTVYAQPQMDSKAKAELLKEKIKAEGKVYADPQIDPKVLADPKALAKFWKEKLKAEGKSGKVYEQPKLDEEALAEYWKEKFQQDKALRFAVPGGPGAGQQDLFTKETRKLLSQQDRGSDKTEIPAVPADIAELLSHKNYGRIALLFDPHNTDMTNREQGGALLLQFARLVEQKLMPIVINGAILYNFLPMAAARGAAGIGDSVDKTKHALAAYNEAHQRYRMVIEIPEKELKEYEELQSKVDQLQDYYSNLMLRRPGFVTRMTGYGAASSHTTGEQESRLREELAQAKADLKSYSDGALGDALRSVRSHKAWTASHAAIEAESKSLRRQYHQVVASEKSDVDRQRREVQLLGEIDELDRKKFQMVQLFNVFRGEILKKRHAYLNTMKEIGEKQLWPAYEEYQKLIDSNPIAEIAYYIQKDVNFMFDDWLIYQVPGQDIYLLIPKNYKDEQIKRFGEEKQASGQLMAYSKLETEFGLDGSAFGLDIKSLQQFDSLDDLKRAVNSYWAGWTTYFSQMVFSPRPINVEAVLSLFIHDSPSLVSPWITYLTGYGKSARSATDKKAVIAGFTLNDYKQFHDVMSPLTAFLYYVSCFGGDVNLSLIENHIINQGEEDDIRQAVNQMIGDKQRMSIAAGAVLNAQTFARATLTPNILGQHSLPINFNVFVDYAKYYLHLKQEGASIAEQKNALLPGLNAVGPSFSAGSTTIAGVSAIPMLWQVAEHKFVPLVDEQDLLIDELCFDRAVAGVLEVTNKRSVLLQITIIPLKLNITADPDTRKLPQFVPLIVAEADIYINSLGIPRDFETFLRESIFSTVVAYNKTYYINNISVTHLSHDAPVITHLDAQNQPQQFGAAPAGNLQASEKRQLSEVVIEMIPSRFWWSKQLDKPTGTIRFRAVSHGELQLYEAKWDAGKQEIVGDWSITIGEAAVLRREIELWHAKYQAWWARWYGYHGGYIAGLAKSIIEKIEKKTARLKELGG